MNLRDAINAQCDGETLYIGASSGFIFIGEKCDAIAAMEEASGKMIHHEIKATLNNLAYSIKTSYRGIAESVCELSALENEEKYNFSDVESEIKALKDSVEAYECRLKKADKKYRNVLEYARKFVPYLEREVVDVYNRKFYEPFGKIIVFDGKESGSYWSMDEVADQ